MNDHLGISIALSPELVSELKAIRQFEHQEEQPKGLEVLTALPVVSVQEDWDCLLPAEIDVEELNEVECINDDNCAEEFNGMEDDGSAGWSSSCSVLSYTAPTCLPVVLVDVQRLAGYIPSSPDETESLKRTIRTALWGEVELPSTLPAMAGSDEKKDTPDEAATAETMLIARDFDQRITDLFATGMARHSDTSLSAHDEAVTATTYVAVDYPEYLCRMGSNDTSENDVQVSSTARVWKQLMQPHPIAVVDRLLQSWLKVCSRSLLWKLDMRHEIVCLADAEDKDMKRRQAEAALHEWKSGRRKEQLDKLYAARETLAERYQQARDDQTTLEQERDVTVQLELRRRREDGGNGGIETFDFESTVFAFPDNPTPDLFLGFVNDDYPCDYSEDNDDNSYHQSQSSCDDNASLAQEEATTEPEDVAGQAEPTVSSHNKKERRQRAAQIRHQRLRESVREAEHKSKLNDAKREEEQVRERHTTLQLRMAAALAVSLQTKLREVDELLETMQEEQWADEEEAENENGESSPKQQPEQVVKNTSQFSLLDQVLAMILGACPPQSGIQMADHVCELEKEHRAILDAWLEYFGRLPPAIVAPHERGDENNDRDDWEERGEKEVSLPKCEANESEAPAAPESLRVALGIVDNEDDWDADEVQTSRHPTRQAQPQPSIVGFRPGGRS